MQQMTLATGTFEPYRKATRREIFLSEMDRVVPWAQLCALIEPVYPKAGNGRPPIGLERMLRIYFLQQWFNLSDPGVEEALAYLEAQGLRISRGTIVDATIINAPSSTKNAGKTRDPDMHQTRKGQQWYFGMKAHVGVDSRSKLIHSVVATAANVADSTVLPDLLHGDETRVWGDQAYRGQREVIREVAPQAQDCTNRRYRYQDRVDEVERAKNKTKSQVRAKVEHVFAVIKLKFGFTKVRYRGLDKNAHRLFVTCALTNLFLARRQLLRLVGA